ncbi:hypothetical protein [Methylobacterium flocculans]|uniref:hypothetical protein n=1 Tax=Methylobacterium flocculans TaxID=2984843 RepID=UPI0021F34895|nr:hypothetical protein [Methylobacterium sp. FF17]
MKKRERNALQTLRRIPSQLRTRDQIRNLLKLAAKQQRENRTNDPIRPQEKRP